MVIRWANSLINFVQKGKPIQQDWVKVSFISASLLLLSLFSLGVLKTVGVGSEGHQHQSNASTSGYQQFQVPSYPAQPTTVYFQQMQLQAQINSMIYQLNAMQANLNQNSMINR